MNSINCMCGNSEKKFKFLTVAQLPNGFYNEECCPQNGFNEFGKIVDSEKVDSNTKARETSDMQAAKAAAELKAETENKEAARKQAEVDDMEASKKQPKINPRAKAAKAEKDAYDAEAAKAKSERAANDRAAKVQQVKELILPVKVEVETPAPKKRGRKPKNP